MKNKFLYVFFILFIIYAYYSYITTDRDNYEATINEKVCGEIVRIYRDPPNHNVETFDVKRREWSSTFIADFYPSSWEYASVGDSVIKLKGDSFITIKKKNGESKTFETRIKP